MAGYRRGIFLINRPFQLRFSIYVASWVLAVSFVYPLLVHNLFEYVNQIVVSFAPAQNLADATSSLARVRNEVMGLVLTFEVLFIALTFVASIFISHRIAGPLYKLSKQFKTAAQGDLHDDLQFRTHDHFRELADDYNIMIRSVRQQVEKRSDAILEAESRIKKALEKASPESKPELEAALKTLSEVHATHES